MLKCTLLGCADTPNVDTDVFSAVNSAELVYDGRLVVDLRFATVDPSVYAAGPLCKFSRRFKHALPHEKFNSREVGTRLAESLLQIECSALEKSLTELLAKREWLKTAPPKKKKEKKEERSEEHTSELQSP